jgi:hypothetical protein
MSSMPREERAEMRRRGLDRPGISYRGTQTLSDMAESPDASVDFDYETLDRPPEDVIKEHPLIQELIRREAALQTAEVLNRVIADIYDSQDYRLRMAVIVVARGLRLFAGISGTEIAKRHQVSKQDLWKHVALYQRLHNLPPTRAQKKKKAGRTVNRGLQD